MVPGPASGRRPAPPREQHPNLVLIRGPGGGGEKLHRRGVEHAEECREGFLIFKTKALRFSGLTLLLFSAPCLPLSSRGVFVPPAPCGYESDGKVKKIRLALSFRINRRGGEA